MHWVRHRARSVAKGEETRGAARLGLVGVDWKGLVVTSARMCNMIGASADRAFGPGVEYIEYSGVWTGIVG